MKSMASVLLGLVLCGATPAPSDAWECSQISTAEVQAALKEVGLPKLVLTKSHVDLTRFDHFLECPPQMVRFASRYVYSDRNLEPPYYEGVSFTFYKFSTTAIRDARMSKIMSADSEAQGNPDLDVFYYLPPDRADAILVRRRQGIPIE